ncbi:MAG: UDP-N-acetylmuramoyl-L-alanyl-D-glutamate--2,6-diaminopimelate ligase, partial [Chitinophagales bacterium]
MATLKDILYKVPLKAVKGDTYKEVSGIHFDSRKIQKGQLFVAVKGTQTDGHQFISAAIDNGAVAVICEEMPVQLNPDVSYLEVENASKSLAIVAANYYDNPSEQLKLVGITGTNGKTTVATLLYQLFSDLGNKCGLLSTVRILIADKELDATHTTPDALSIQKVLREMVDTGCTYCFMETSSHAIVQNRTYKLDFDAAVFTNISHDHLDYHETFANYIKAKKQLFDDLPADAFAIVNRDDKRHEVMLQNTAAHKVTFALHSPADFHLRMLENTFTGLLLDIDGTEFHSLLVGEFNAYNLLSAYATA